MSLKVVCIIPWSALPFKIKHEPLYIFVLKIENWLCEWTFTEMWAIRHGDLCNGLKVINSCKADSVNHHTHIKADNRC